MLATKEAFSLTVVSFLLIKPIDYRDEMNGDHFAQWLEHKLFPNVPAGAAVVVDNAPYHTVRMKEPWAPTSKALKADMQVWLTERNISWRN